ncbi:MAG TPA: hypothetical protein ENK31_08510, partial [Nannocystis exedens]|nr:hypothetical protein [Nannocystis exedens]
RRDCCPRSALAAAVWTRPVASDLGKCQRIDLRHSAVILARHPDIAFFDHTHHAAAIAGLAFIGAGTGIAVLIDSTISIFNTLWRRFADLIDTNHLARTVVIDGALGPGSAGTGTAAIGIGRGRGRGDRPGGAGGRIDGGFGFASRRRSGDPGAACTRVGARTAARWIGGRCNRRGPATRGRIGGLIGIARSARR